MKQDWTPTQIRRAAWIGGGAVALIALVPIVPSVASALSPTSGSSAHVAAPTLTHLEVVAANATLQPGQIHQMSAGTQMYIQCPGGRALDGGYSLPFAQSDEIPLGSMVVSAPDERDSAKWNFRYSGVAPVGTRFYATCWQG